MDPIFKNKQFLKNYLIFFNIGYGLLFLILLYFKLSYNNGIEGFLNNHAMEIMNIRWEEYKHRNKKLYVNEEIENNDKKKYFETHNIIDKHNYNFMNNKTFYQMKYYDNIHIGNRGININGKLINSFFDQKMLSGMKYYTFVSTKHDWELPASVDWRTKGAVTKVKEQGMCGSCWAFSTLGALETQYFLKTGNLVSLSAQQLVDCGFITSNHGCDGGSFYTAYDYLENYGVVADSNYPYYGIQFKCPYLSHVRKIKIDGQVYLQQSSEQELKEAVATIGPIAVAISAYTFEFSYYLGGIAEGTYCEPTMLDHGVLVVGYGTDSYGGDYWIIKNSWGEYWGEGGYMRLRRNQNKRSCIGLIGSYPLLR